MTLTHTQKKTVKAKSGMTLIELTVVILVLLSLISILFVGARAWKKGSDRAGCIMNIRNVQQAARSYQNMYNTNAIPAGELVGNDKFMENTPSCPDATGVYTPDPAVAGTAPAVGTLYMTCSLNVSDNHQPAVFGDW